MLNLHFPKEHRVSAFSEKTDTQLALSGYFIQIYTSLIGVGKSSTYQSHLGLASCKSRQLTQISVPFDYGNSRFAWSVLGPRSVAASSLTHRVRLSRETVPQGLNSLRTIS